MERACFSIARTGPGNSILLAATLGTLKGLMLETRVRHGEGGRAGQSSWVTHRQFRYLSQLLLFCSVSPEIPDLQQKHSQNYYLGVPTYPTSFSLLFSSYSLSPPKPGLASCYVISAVYSCIFLDAFLLAFSSGSVVKCSLHL